METNSTRSNYKRTFSESDSSSRTERYLCSFSHLWIINYLSSYIDDSHSTCLQSETFSPVNTPYSNTRWSLKLYPRGLDEKQHTNNNIAIFLKYVSGTISTIKAKAEFCVVSRNNELVMLRSTNFHTFSSGNDWGYSEFLDGNYLNSRRNDLLTDDRLRVYIRVILVDEKEISTGDLFHPPPPPPPPPSSVNTLSKSQPSSSSASSSTSINSNPSLPLTTSSNNLSGLFRNEEERFASLELLSNQIKTLLDDERFTDVNIHVLPKQEKSLRMKRISVSSQYEQSLAESPSIRRTTRSSTSRIAQSSSDLCTSSSNCKQCLSHDQENQFDLDKYSHLSPLATFHVHKSILIARSSSFAHQIHHSPVNIYIDDLEPLTVRTMLIYIYTGCLPTMNDETYKNLNSIDLFRASVKYNLNELRDLAKVTMLDGLKIDNAMEILEVSDQANDSNLKQQILSFIRSNASAISKTTNWIDSTKQNPQLIIDAFRSLVTPTITKHANHYHHSTSLTTKQSKTD